MVIMHFIIFTTILVWVFGLTNSQLTLELLEQKIDALTERVSLVEEENSILQAENAELKLANKRIMELLPSENQTTDTGKQKRLLLQNNIQHNPSSSPLTAFSAALNHHVTLGTHQTVEYENVITNIGHAYDPKHGHFIAPAKGIYLISVTGYNYNDIVTYLELMHDGNVVINLFMDGRNGMNSGVTETLFLVLEEGDMVWVRGRAGGKLFGDPTENCNSFSGFLLAKL